MVEKKLLEKISDIKFLGDAWNKLYKVNKFSCGLSGETIEVFEKNKEDKLKSISEKLKAGKYKFSPTRGVLIPKNGKSKYRPLQIPEVSDRVVIKAIAIELEGIFSNVIEKSQGYSFAYQKDIGVREAVTKIKEHYENGYPFVLEADLVNFFGTVDKKNLLEKNIFPNLPDESLNNLIYDALNQRIGNINEFNNEQKVYFEGIENGIPQGNALSPLFSNIYLSDFDLPIINAGYKLVRYADDFVVLCKSENECFEAYQKASEILKSINLEIHPLEEKGKTKITDIKNENVTFLSVTFDGNDLFPSRENFERLKNKIWELNKNKIELSLIKYLTSLKNRHEGWISAFIYTDLLRYSSELDFEINRAIYLKLNAIGWKLSQSKLGKLPQKYASKNQSRECISEEQRGNSGVPMTNELVNLKRQHLLLLERINESN